MGRNIVDAPLHVMLFCSMYEPGPLATMSSSIVLLAFYARYAALLRLLVALCCRSREKYNPRSWARLPSSVEYGDNAG